MADSYWKSGSGVSHRKEITWPSAAQILRQLGIALLTGLLWTGLLVGYLRLTGQSPADLPTAAPEVVAKEISPTRTPTSQPTHTPLPTNIPSPTNETPLTAAPASVAADTPTVEPSPTPTDTPMPTETPVPPTDTPVLDTESTTAVSFADDVLPIFERRCVQCHGGEKPEGGRRIEEGLILQTYADVITGSWNGPVIEPGSAADSYLIELISAGEMPKKGPRLLPAEIRTISAWIDAGAPDN